MRRPGLAALLLASGLAAAEGRPPALPFVEDDYARALAEARSRELPLFVETWAPW